MSDAEATVSPDRLFGYPADFEKIAGSIAKGCREGDPEYRADVCRPATLQRW